MIYAQIMNQETGAVLAVRSTKTTDRDQAVLTVGGWLRDGLPQKAWGKKPRPLSAAVGLAAILTSIKETPDLDADGAAAIAEALRDRGLLDFHAVKSGPGNVNFIRFLSEFWDYEKSPYIQEKLAHGYKIGQRYCYELKNRITGYWEPFFEGRTLRSITREDIKAFSLHLAKPKEPKAREKGRGGKQAVKIAPGTISMILKAGLTALKYAYREKMISENPGEGILKFTGGSKKRGVLTLEEAMSVFAVKWPEKRAFAGNLLSMTTGLRSGEVLALRKSDIDPQKPILYIRHSWSPQDGLKSPKNGEERRVPLLPEVRAALMDLLAENPYKDTPDPFIFYSVLLDRPMDNKFLIDGLKAACKAIEIDPVARNIVFHSWRHFYAARMVDKMTAEQVQRVTGHKSRAVFEEYADHVTEENLEAMGKAGAEVFGNILPFKNKKGA
jgi:integrase